MFRRLGDEHSQPHMTVPRHHQPCRCRPRLLRRVTCHSSAVLSIWVGLSCGLPASVGAQVETSGGIGAHAPAVSSYDSRASSVVFAYRRGVFDDGSLNTFSYSANFTSTTGILSSQFTLHYLNMGYGEDKTAHGLSGSATAVWVVPTDKRHDNGVPELALAPYLGITPTVFVGDKYVFGTLPLTLGMGFPMAPGSGVILTPWMEFSPSFNFASMVDLEGVDFDELNAQYAAGDEIDHDAVGDMLSSGFEIEMRTSQSLRGGVMANIALGYSADLNLYSMFSTMGSSFRGTLVKQLGAALLLRWDSIVAPVLPAKSTTTPGAYGLDAERCGRAWQTVRMCHQRQQQTQQRPAPVYPQRQTRPAPGYPQRQQRPAYYPQQPPRNQPPVAPARQYRQPPQYRQPQRSGPPAVYPRSNAPGSSGGANQPAPTSRPSSPSRGSFPTD